MLTAVVLVGNSDDKLTQAEWSQLVQEVRLLVAERVAIEDVHQHFEGFALADLRYQNACWVLEFSNDAVTDGVVEDVQEALTRVAREYRQEAITWLQGTPQFVTPEGVK